MNIDLQKIAFLVDRTFKLRLRSRIKRKCENPTVGFVYNHYKHSKQIRFIKNQAVAPIGAVVHRNPMYKPVKVNKYTEEGRALIHKSLEKVNMGILHYLMAHPVKNRSVEYNDSRLALYCAQTGKCAVTGKILELDRIHLHHKTTIRDGGTDEYRNLIMFDIDVHRLIHATKSDIVEKYVQLIQPNYNQRDKINRLRKRLNLEPIAMQMAD